MTTVSLSDRDRAEVERSAAEAAKVRLSPAEVDRYLNTQANTPYALEFVFHLLGDIQGKTVLDLGCGTGENLIPLLKRGALVIAIDISPELVALARRSVDRDGINPGNATFQVASAYGTRLPDESIDVVLSAALLHHLDLPKACAEIYRILRPGGRLILKEPVRFSAAMNWLRKLFPAPKGDISDFEHPLMRDELAVVTEGFTLLADRNFRLPLVPLLSGLGRWQKQIWEVDCWLLQRFPRLEHFATSKVMNLQK